MREDIPILAHSAEALETLRAREDMVDANIIGEMVAGDPLMTLRVLEFAASHRPPRLVTDPETVTAAVVMMGIAPFFRAFATGQPTVEDRLQALPQALAGLQQVLHRAHRAANFAACFAVHRMDTDAPIVHQAALLHGFAEILLWCYASPLALGLSRLQQANPTLRSSVAQQAVLNIELADLQQALMQAWRLPELLTKVSDDRHAEHPSVKSVALAVRLARHSAHGWDNPALPDDYSEIAVLLNLSVNAASQLVNSVET